MHGLEPVPHVRQRATHDDRHGVVKVGALHFGLQVDLLNPVGQRSPGQGSLVPGCLGNLITHWFCFRSKSLKSMLAGRGMPANPLDVQEAHVLGVLLDEAAA